MAPFHGCATHTHFQESYAHLLHHHLHFSNLLLAHLIPICTTLHRIHPSPHPLPPMPLPPPFQCHPQGPFPLPSCHPRRPQPLLPSPLPLPLPQPPLLCPLLKAASFLPSALGHSIHALTFIFRFTTHPSVFVGILEIYTSFSKIESAHQVFDDMFQKDVVAYNLMINGYYKRGDFESGFGSYPVGF